MDLVYNPTAGSFHEGRLAALIEAFRLHNIDARPVATAIGSVALSANADCVCVHGGDGTLRDTVQALRARASSVPLCIAPAGTINLVARELGYAKDPTKLAGQIRAAWDRGPQSWTRSPLYRLGDTPIVSCMSVGPDSAAVAGIKPALKRRIGRYAYVVSAMRQMYRWQRQPMALTGELADGTPFACEAEMMILSRGALYAGPFRLSPAAGLRSDSVELITIRRSTRFSAMAFSAAAAVRLPVGKLGLCEIRSVRRISFEETVIPLQIDGDIMPYGTGSIAPSGLNLTYCI